MEVTTDGADGYVHADAVWVGSANMRSIVVSGDGQQLTNKVSVIDLGYVELNPNPTPELDRVITVQSTGGEPVKVFLPIEVPAGFRQVQSIDDLDILDGVLDGMVWLNNAQGTYDATGVDPNYDLPISFPFTIRVDAAAPGNVSGTVSMMNEATDPDPFQFAMAAQVGVTVIDNDDPGFF